MKQKDYLAIFLPQDGFEWHNEDSSRVSKRFPVFAVGDGVTETIAEELVHPSGPKQAADIFCERAIEFSERRFKKLSLSQLRLAYQYANRAIRRFNRNHKENYAAVGSLIVVKENKILCSRITDSGFALIRSGRLVFKTPEFWSWLKLQKKKKYGRLDGKSMRIGSYVDLFELFYKHGDTLTLFTDGFENHFANSQFVKLFKIKNLKDLEKKIQSATAKLAAEDSEKFGHERTLLVVKL